MSKNALSRKVRPYTLFLLLLLVLSAAAVYTMLTFLSGHPALQAAPDVLAVAKLMFFLLSLGILCMAGALGLWGLGMYAEGESRRRVGRLIDGMDYVPDGVVAVDPKGRVVGLNRAARVLTGMAGEQDAQLRGLFPCLGARELSVLLDQSRPREVECAVDDGDETRTLRFRSEPVDGLNQILVSDVSDLKARDRRDRHTANLQLIGRIASGVAHDFNTVLCAISGHAALLNRACGSRGQVSESLHAILREAERGAGLARQLVDLSRTTVDASGTDQLPQHVAKARELLALGLPGEWEVIITVPAVSPRVPFSGLQIEQLVTKLGLLAIASRQAPGELQVCLRPPGAVAPWDVSSAFAGVLFVGSDPDRPGRLIRSACETAPAEKGGVILSVLQTMIDDVGGRLDVFRDPGGVLNYRVCIPRYKPSGTGDEGASCIPEELHSYLAEWSVLMACPAARVRQELERRMRELGIEVHEANNLVDALAHIEQQGKTTTGMVIDKEVTGDETESLLRAVLKLQPGMGIVLLDGRPELLPGSLRHEVVCASGAATPEETLRALIQSRERAAQRASAAMLR